MDVSAAGTGSPIPDSPVRLNGPGGASPHTGAIAGGISGDAVGPHLQLLSTPQIHGLLHNIDAHRLSPDPAALNSLLQTAGAAVARHDVPRALAVLTEYVNRNPEHAGTLPTNPGLIPIQGEVRGLLRHITEGAQNDAVRLITAANQAVDVAAQHPEGLNAAGVLAVAGRLVESGQLANYIRAAELSQAVLALYAGAAPEVVRDAVRRKLIAERTVRHPAREWAGALWRRVPLLVLLTGWLALGLAGALLGLLARIGGEPLSAATVQAGFEFWGVGFLALILIQFWISVRSFR